MLTLTPPSLDGLSNGYITSFNLPVTWPALSPTGTRESYFSGILEISLCSSLLSQSPVSFGKCLSYSNSLQRAQLH